MRLFFALWPDDAVRKQIARIGKKAAKEHLGKRMQPDNLHLTLAFLGNVDETQYDCVSQLADEISFSPFDLYLDHIGTFPRAKVIWLGASNAPAEVSQLGSTLNQQARDCDIEMDNKFHTHVTLMRKVNRFHEMEVEPVHWHVDHFCLVQSFTYPEGVQYKVVKSWRGI